MICISPIAPFGETARGPPPLSIRITARIQLPEILNLCEASATNAVKGRAGGGVAVPAIAAGSAWTEWSNGAPEQKKSEAAQIIAWTNGDRAGALASPVADNTTRWIRC
jgi:hypothetical protein